MNTANHLKISVLVPAYNAEDSIDQTLRSLTNQTYENFEVIVVDDGSKHPLVSFLFDHRTDIEIKLITHEVNKGVNAAINTALDAASGDAFCILAADDELPPDSLELRANALVNLNADIVLGGLLVNHHSEKEFFSSINVSDISTIIMWLSTDSKPKREGINNATALTRMSLLKQSGVREITGYSSHEDYEFVLRLLSMASNPVSINDIVYIYNMDDSGLMHRSMKALGDDWQKAQQQLEQKYLEIFKGLKKQR